MEEKNGKQGYPGNKKKGTILGSLLSRQDPDKTYLPELQSQWQKMNRIERIKFIIGIVVGLTLFIAALVGTYLLLSIMIG